MNLVFVRESFKNSRGSTLISTMIAVSLILISILGVGSASLHLTHSMKKAEIANLAIEMEADLVKSFQDKINYPDPGSAGPHSPNAALRAGTLSALQVQTPFGVINAPVQAPGQSTVKVGYLGRDLQPCGANAFSDTCVLRYQVGLKKIGAGYSFSYQIDANPEIIQMSPVGDVTKFNVPIDPGNYRVGTSLSLCDSENDAFMIGMNRDTGEAYCLRKPLTSKCSDGTMPKGLRYDQAPADGGRPVLKLECTSSVMRQFHCSDDKYALQEFNAQYFDPNKSFSRIPGTCVFRTKHSAPVPGSFPENPRSPYRRNVSGTFCPVHYAVSNASACQLVPDENRNSAAGLGKCGVTAYKNCHRQTWNQISDSGAAHATWATCVSNAAAQSQPASTCGSEPANPALIRSYCADEVSGSCNQVANQSSSCTYRGDWDSGTAYATSISTVGPTARAVASLSGPNMTCTFQDTTPSCDAPEVDIEGHAYGKRQGKWYGGVQVSGAVCTFSPTPDFPETKDAY